MADKAVSELNAATMVKADDNFVLEQDGAAKRLDGQTLINHLLKMIDGHGGIHTIAKVGGNGLTDIYRMTFADTSTFDYTLTNGRGIQSIAKTKTAGLVDTYTIAYNDGTAGTFTVTNGAKGATGDAWYVHIKYASQKPTAASHSIGDLPDDWIGIYSGTVAAPPSDWAQYQWYRIRGDQGETGAPAQVIASVVEYQAGSSGAVMPSGVWTTGVPTVSQGNFLWTRTTVQFNSGAPVVSYGVSRFGVDGSGSVSAVCGVSPDGSGNVALDAEAVGALPVGGGVMQGGISMDGHAVTGLTLPQTPDSAACKSYVDLAHGAVNLLDNSDFRDPVNQRNAENGTVPMQYCIDRWIATSRWALMAGRGIALENGGGLLQYVPASRIDSTSPYTFVVAAYDGLHLMSLGGYSEQNNAYICAYTNNSGANNLIYWAALYKGTFTAETLPPYVPKGYGQEMLECQRYFRVLNVLFGTDVGSTQRQMTILTPVMRVSPTAEITITGGDPEAGYSVNFINAGTTDITFTSWGTANLVLSADL